MNRDRWTDDTQIDVSDDRTTSSDSTESLITRAMPSRDSFPPPAPLLSTPSVKSFAGYEIQGELGRGGMGVVYLARQVELNRLVALKMLTGHYGGDELKRFLAEAETAAGLNHTNIAHIYEVGEFEGAPFFSMEYVEGGSLADLIRKDPPAPRAAAQLMISIARALHYAHQNGVVHRDMKPANVLLDFDGVPKVADFGIAKRLNDDSQLTRTGAIIGTPTYMAPEQATGNSRHVGPAADVYSLGAILYELLAGRPPFLPEDNDAAITVRVLTEDPVSPAWHNNSTPRDLETICMKCLEKEPSNRYQSAAAFAEDLRRYLDDESILAKPPSTAVSSIKWVRRNPWKFVGVGLGALLFVAALGVLARWELYQRPHLEYARSVDWKNGVLEPVESISLRNTSVAPSYVRLTRRGRYGPIIKAEVLNSRGHPAVLRRVFNDEVIPIYVEGLGGAQPYAERLPETTTVDFIVDQSEPVEATGRDRNGQINWRLIYDRNASSGTTARARFVNTRGFDSTSSQLGASHLEFERDRNGRDAKITFFNASGKPAQNGERVYGYKIERDNLGRIIAVTNLGEDGQPVPNRIGMTAFSVSWGQPVRFEVTDGKGQSIVWQGIRAIVTEMDAAGNAIKISHLAPDGKPIHEATAEWSVEEINRDQYGEVTRRTFYKADANGSLNPISHSEISYDIYGHPADIKFEGAASWRSAMSYDANGNVIEEKFLNPKGEPIANDKGYAIRRSTYTPSAQGLRIEQTYFDAAGNKTYCTAGYHRLIDEYDVTGVLKRQTMDEHDPAKYKYYRYVTVPEYDAQGRSRHSISRFEDAQGQLASNADLEYTSDEEIYDENGKLTTQWKLGADPKLFGGPIVRIDSEWHTPDKLKRRVRQICDENRQPMSTVHTGIAAHYEETYDYGGQRERIYETGFDENIVGFTSREAKFFGGALQTVTHLRGDGSVPGSVLVFISSVEPPANQPKSAELKAGDQLLAVNGKPVGSVYAWLFSGNFPGGSVEVLRDGKHIRIDGFNPGLLGVSLEDRATPMKKVA